MHLRNNQPNSASLNWSSLQHLLETAVPHVLIILDCCFAANAARDTAEGSTKEILAACGRESPTLGVCDRSFTAVLVEEMQAFGKTPFTVAMLHSRLVTMRWRLAFTPIYALLSEHGGSSIAISPVTYNSKLSASRHCLGVIPSFHTFLRYIYYIPRYCPRSIPYAKNTSELLTLCSIERNLNSLSFF